MLTIKFICDIVLNCISMDEKPLLRLRVGKTVIFVRNGRGKGDVKSPFSQRISTNFTAVFGHRTMSNGPE